MYIACEKCKWNYEGACDFYHMGSGDEIDMPCYRERKLIEEAQEELLESASQGYWTKEHGSIYKCSNCRNLLDFDGVNAGRGDANYCPNCGTRMKVEE